MLEDTKVIFYLKLCTCLIFIGRAYQYIFFDAPFRVFFWDEGLLKPIMESFFDISWHDYATNLKVDYWIGIATKVNGFLFILAALCCFFISKVNRKLLKFPIYIAVFFIVILGFLALKDRFYQFAQFFEYGIQIGVPLALLYTLKANYDSQKLIVFLKVVVSITFFAHGLYAIGYYPIPGHFVDMTINSLGVQEDIAIKILYVAGILDLLIAVLIFVPKASKYALLYAFIWGILTALARIVSDYNSDFISHSLHQLGYKVLFRLPNGIIPLFILIYTTSPNGNPFKLHYSTTKL